MRGHQIDFNRIIDRRNTNSLKYDFAKRRGMREDALPMWVADMDFAVPGEVLEALHERTRHGVFGYSEVQESYFEPLQAWMKNRHDWEVERRWLVKTPGIVYAIAMAIQAYTRPGEAVLIQQPVYYPFHEVIEDNDRVLVDNTLILGADGKYQIDFADFEQKIIAHKVKLFLLCSPHNPVGRVWSREELLQIARICIRHDVIVVSDEIHQDFVYEGSRHYVFADICEEIKERVILCTSPSKTFNLAGLQVSNIFIPNRELRHKFRKRIDASGYSQLNTFGLTACEAAYRHGREWLDELLVYLKDNISYLRNYLAERIPEIKLVEPEGTYLLWLDFRDFSRDDAQVERLVGSKAKLWLDSGRMFGSAGAGFQRINIACPRAVLEQALSQLENALLTEKWIERGRKNE